MIKQFLKKIFGFGANKKKGWDKQFTGAYPRSSGAKSAVTGGSPEDINEMPAATDPESEGPIYDGSSLDKGPRKKAR